jgi:dTMP kinase
MRVDAATFTCKNPRGFIVVEGVNGAGKSTLLEKIARLIRSKNRPLILTKEPGGTSLGKEIRAIVLEQRAGPLSSRAEVLLFAADRAEHVATVITPALSRKDIVVSDRYLYSSIAFQGYGRELGAEQVHQINQYAIGSVRPDFVIMLDLDPLTGLQRAKKRSSNESAPERDSFEEEELAFHERIRSGFLEMADTYQEPFIVLDASKTPEAVFAEVAPVIERWLEACG